MAKVAAWIGGVLALGLLAAGAAAQPPPGAKFEPLVLPNTTVKVSPHVWVIPDRSTPLVPNIGIIVGSRAALVVDTGLGERNGAVALAEARKAAPGRALYLMSTHVHPEHDLGAGAFPPETKMIRSQAEVAEIAETGLSMAQRFSQMSPLNAELLKGATFRKADIVFDKAYDLDLGGVSVRLIAVGPNHTAGDTVAWVPADKVLFAGDVAMKGQPAFASPHSSLAHWLGALDTLEALKPAIVVPSHGPVGGPAFIGGYRTYLTAIRDRARALKAAGKSQEETVAAVSAELKDRYPDTGRMAGAIRAAYAEAN
ncbi:MBL fold metallo-hydrolase [Phenylobacterium sp.]|jgi:glyoxylase-like metal-dependent hydrolase (beta-lactamase superfamily II)|uniref:MBL fold metallo-hydrolase n=1 Tax=Phenylobacterium sp. TaxID=1871053 RepID=UPI002F3FA3F9